MKFQITSHNAIAKMLCQRFESPSVRQPVSLLVFCSEVITKEIENAANIYPCNLVILNVRKYPDDKKM